MKILKKITLTTLMFLFTFLIVGQKYDFEASSEWTLDNGYYYYNKEIKFNEEVHYLVSNGNPIFIKDNDTDKWMIYDYKISLKAKIYPKYDKNAVVQYSPANVNTGDYYDVYYPVSGGTYENHSYDEESVVPITIRYSADIYNSNSPGDLSLIGYPSYELIKTTVEEFEFVGWPRQYGFQIKHNYAIADINDPNFIKHNLKIFFHEHYLNSERQGILYDLEKVVFQVEKIGEEKTYWKLLTPETDIINVPSFNELPITSGNFENGLTGTGRVFVDEIGSDYKLQINYNNRIYQLLVDNIPEYISKSKKIYYFTDKGQRYFVGFYDNEVKWTETSEFHTNLMDNSYIVWNASTGDFMMSEINFVPARLGDTGHSWSKANRLYADVIIPHSIDDLLAISVSYKYQYHYLIGDPGAWTTVDEQILLTDRTSPGEPPWWSHFFLVVPGTRQIPVDEINEITITNEYKHSYLNWLNDEIKDLDGWDNKVYSSEEVFPVGSKAYSLYLGTFNKFWSTGVAAKEFTILQYRYEYKGVEYSNPYPPTFAPEYTPPDRSLKAPDWFLEFLGKIWAFILKYVVYLIPVFAAISYPIIFKVLQGVIGTKVNKRRILGFFIYTALLYLIWYLVI